MLDRRCDAAGVKRFHWHWLRHHFAHRFQAQGGNLDALSKLGGWSSQQVMRRYGSALAKERALDAYDDVGPLL